MELPVNKIICGDCIEVMREWPAESVDCCITSPPYWGLRDYGCDGQLGLEKTPEEYVAKMVQVFAEVKRLLKPTATLWLNLGDSYVSGKGRYSSCPQTISGRERNEPMNGNRPDLIGHAYLKDKDLCGIPWRVALALQADGWYLRQDIIWAKPNPMPESVTDRCTKSHEYMFLLSKSARYYFDNEAIKEDLAEITLNRIASGKWESAPDCKLNDGVHSMTGDSFNKAVIRMAESGKRNKRSVWTVPTKPYKEAHFATFPPTLILPCVLAGTIAKGCCSNCGAPTVRVVNRKRLARTELPKDDPRYRPNTYDGSYGDINGKPDAGYAETETVGWKSSCQCRKRGLNVPAIILDPFMGSGTTAEVAYKNNRNYVGCELNPEYCKMDRGEKQKQKMALFSGDK
jgi:DNA modification methylase